MKDYQSLSHTKWECKYHLVFIPKRRSRRFGSRGRGRRASTSDAKTDADVYKDVRSYDAGFKLQDPSLLAGRAEFEDGITLVILSIFPMW